MISTEKSERGQNLPISDTDGLLSKSRSHRLTILASSPQMILGSNLS
ncbi:glutathione-disulfide reductase, partial [Moniliophthora roreri]